MNRADPAGTAFHIIRQTRRRVFNGSRRTASEQRETRKKKNTSRAPRSLPERDPSGRIEAVSYQKPILLSGCFKTRSTRSRKNAEQPEEKRSPLAMAPGQGIVIADRGVDRSSAAPFFFSAPPQGTSAIRTPSDDGMPLASLSAPNHWPPIGASKRRRASQLVNTLPARSSLPLSAQK